ncbi:hypothetical protein LCGC14_1487530 [marine sediment metagenome]|uniref:Uncharacterized protein n=1 Tax=marine sediment metagenome TaxID=412755 RepID=A0A0F9M9M5_9ZZZZ
MRLKRIEPAPVKSNTRKYFVRGAIVFAVIWALILSYVGAKVVSAATSIDGLPETFELVLDAFQIVVDFAWMFIQLAVSL